MSPAMTFRIAFKALGRNKMRTGLTMLGMIIGVAAVITMVALGNGAQSAIEDQIKSAGTNMITINAGNFTAGGVRQGSGAASTLTVDDAETIRKEIAGVQYLAAGANSRGQVVAGNQNWATRITGTDVDLPSIRAWAMLSGAFFSDQDVRSAAKVAVLGTTVNEQLFGKDADSVGQLIRINKQPFKIIGVMASKGQGSGDDMDDQILAPYTTVQKKLAGITYLNNIIVSAATADGPARSPTTSTLLRTHTRLGPAGTTTSRSDTREIADVGRGDEHHDDLLAGIAGVSLIVGGIGIMNIMLVSVTGNT